MIGLSSQPNPGRVLARSHWTGIGWIVVVLLTVGAVATEAVAGGLDPNQVAVSPDITMKYAGTVLTDQQASVPGAPANFVDFGTLPVGVEISGFHVGDSAVYFSVDQTAKLGGLVARPQDVVRKEGDQYELVYDGRAERVPASVKIDAVTLLDGDLYLSFDQFVAINDSFIADEDLVIAATHEVVFDGSAAGIPAALDLDAAHFLDGSALAVSFDTGEKIDGLAVADEDILVFEGSFVMAYDGSDIEPNWRSADLKGLYVGIEFETLIFADGFESGDTSAW